MIIGIGIDIIEIERVKTALARKGFAGRVFTEAERGYCESRGVQRVASYAARFAGKEAVLKAMGTGLSGGSWQEVEILPGEAGRPVVKLTGYFAELARLKGVSDIHISLTHARQFAAAHVVMCGGAVDEGGNSGPDAGH